jgi:class 3 adenylate cyclase
MTGFRHAARRPSRSTSAFAMSLASSGGNRAERGREGHIAARVMAAAEPGRIVTSRTVHDLVVGSDIAMDDLGTRPLKGVDGSWRLFAARP